MKQKDCDIIIIGSGLIGIVAAYSLSLLGLKVVIVDQKQIILSGSLKNQSFEKDTRTTAIAEGSKIYLEEIKLWESLKKFAEPIKNIKVIDRNPRNKIDFKNNSKGNNLGYIVKNSQFKSVVINKIRQIKNLKILEKTTLKKIYYEDKKIICDFNKFLIKANLVIAADGKNSTVRSLMSTPVYKKIYKENALVVNFQHKANHNNCAYEFFYSNGPLAVLPMKKKSNFQSSLIWSNKKKFIGNLINSDKDTLIQVLHEKISEYLGEIVAINSKQMFPLSAHINKKFFEEKLIYIGDAAHSIHPIAGQGWNLGLRDVGKLHALTRQYANLGLDIGTERFCKLYHNDCYYDSYRLFQITDKLNSIFMSESKILSSFRNFGFGIINKKDNLKNKITNFAMGLNL